MLGISFESHTLFLSSGQLSANSMRRIKRYDHFCEIVQQICTDHFASRFPSLLCYKVLLFETRKHSQSLQAIWIHSLVGRAPVRELSPRRGRKILIYSSNLITFSKKMPKSGSRKMSEFELNPMFFFRISFQLFEIRIPWRKLCRLLSSIPNFIDFQW